MVAALSPRWNWEKTRCAWKSSSWEGLSVKVILELSLKGKADVTQAIEG